MRPNYLSVKNYRSLVDISVEIPDLAVMIGPNGAGKTALLEIFQLLQRASQQELAAYLEGHGGIQAILSKEALEAELRTISISLGLDAQSTKSSEPLIYSLELTPEQIGYAISSERLSWHFNPDLPRPFLYINSVRGRVQYVDPILNKIVTPTWEYHDTELALAQVPKMYQEPEQLRNVLASTRHYSFLDVSPRSVIRLPQALTPTTRPGPNGESLYSALYNIRALHPDVYERIEALLNQGFIEFRHIEFPVVGAGQVTLAWYERNLRQPLFPNQLSEGTLRFLWLVTILLSPHAPALTLLDEPEVSLHPELLKILAALLQDVSAGQQIIVATHSPDLIHWLAPEEVLVVEKTEGQSRFAWADEMDIESWLDEYTLSDLWRMGNLGGRP